MGYIDLNNFPAIQRDLWVFPSTTPQSGCNEECLDPFAGSLLIDLGSGGWTTEAPECESGVCEQLANLWLLEQLSPAVWYQHLGQGCGDHSFGHIKVSLKCFRQGNLHFIAGWWLLAECAVYYSFSSGVRPYPNRQENWSIVRWVKWLSSPQNCPSVKDYTLLKLDENHYHFYPCWGTLSYSVDVSFGA